MKDWNLHEVASVIDTFRGTHGAPAASIQQASEMLPDIPSDRIKQYLKMFYLVQSATLDTPLASRVLDIENLVQDLEPVRSKLSRALQNENAQSLQTVKALVDSLKTIVTLATECSKLKAKTVDTESKLAFFAAIIKELQASDHNLAARVRNRLLERNKDFLGVTHFFQPVRFDK